MTILDDEIKRLHDNNVKVNSRQVGECFYDFMSPHQKMVANASGRAESFTPAKHHKTATSGSKYEKIWGVSGLAVMLGENV